MLKMTRHVKNMWNIRSNIQFVHAAKPTISVEKCELFGSTNQLAHILSRVRLLSCPKQVVDHHDSRLSKQNRTQRRVEFKRNETKLDGTLNSRLSKQAKLDESKGQKRDYIGTICFILFYYSLASRITGFRAVNSMRF